MNLPDLLAIIHLLAAAFVTGGVFMNVFIVWPAARTTLGRRGFPLEFLVIEGTRIAPWLYSGLLIMLATGLAGALLHPPADGAALLRFAVRAAAWLLMLGNTLYGTLRMWPALQFSTGEEGWQLWRGYLRLGRFTFVGSFVNFLLAAWEK